MLLAESVRQNGHGPQSPEAFQLQAEASGLAVPNVAMPPAFEFVLRDSNSGHIIVPLVSFCGVMDPHHLDLRGRHTGSWMGSWLLGLPVRAAGPPRSDANSDAAHRLGSRRDLPGRRPHSNFRAAV